MLSLAKAAKDYYLQKLGEVSPREDYYLRGGSASGVWRGSGAAEQGLNGTVSTEGLVRLFDVGAALAARTASGLQAATGIPSTSVARFLSEGRYEAGLAPGAVVVIDEASMVGSRHLAAVSDLVDKQQGS